MATVDEILATMTNVDVAKDVNEVLVIDPNTRQINIPGSELIFGVTSDENAERKYFLCPRYVGNGLDLTSCFLRVNYRNANGEIDAHLITDVALTEDAENITFSWELARKVTQYKGQVAFVVCACRPGDNGKLLNEWNTTHAMGSVLDGLEPTNVDVTGATTDVIAQLITMVENQTAAVEAEGGKQIKAVQTAARTAESDAVAQIEAKGVNVRESIPDDYTALSEAVDGLVRGRAGAIVCKVEGSAVTVNDASDNYVQGLKIFGRSTQDGTPTPEAPVEIVSVKNPTITVNEQTLTIPRILPGIPVTSGGNYTDGDGQQWICDEVDLERGVYVQRVIEIELEAAHGMTYNSNDNFLYYSLNPYGVYGDRVYCTHFDSLKFNGNGSSLKFPGFTNADEFKSFAGENIVKVLYRTKSPIETPLSETEIAAYRALHSNYPNTTVLNDAGAHMVVKYAADTKRYIDNKIAALIGG